MLHSVLFYLFSTGIILSAIGVVTSRSAVHSTLLLVLTMCFTGCIFALLKAYLVAIILILVYAGAILTLFLFVVMLVDYRKLADDWKGSGLTPLLAGALAVVVFWQIFSVIRSFPKAPMLQNVPGTAEAIGRGLFNQYVLPFELTAFLILAAVVSVVVLAKKEKPQ